VVQGRDQRAAIQQRGNCEREGNREADVAHVEHRRVEHHAWILQQRVQVAAVRRRRQQSLEGVGGEQHEAQEADAHQAHHAEDARREILRQAAAEHGNGEHPARQHQYPQQQRALMAAPSRGNAIGGGQLGIGVGGDVHHREIVAVERPRQATEGDGDEDELALRRGASDRHQAGYPLCCAVERQRALRQCQGEREDQREISEFRDHLGVPAAGVTTLRPAFSASAFDNACAASGGM
jgi:hypothetical protein